MGTICLLMLPFGAPAAHADGCVTVTTSLTLTAGMHEVPCGIEVKSGGTLTVEAGATLKFHPSAFLVVEGRLRVLGTQDRPVELTSIRDGRGVAEPDDWEGVLADPDGNAAGPVIEVRHARVSYSRHGLRVRSATSATVVDSRFVNNENHGLVVHATAVPPRITGNGLAGNGNGSSRSSDHVAAGWIHSDHLDPALIAGNYGSGNAVNTLLLSGTFDRNGTLYSQPAFPIGLGTGHCTVYDDCHNLAQYKLGVGKDTALTVAPGSVIKAADPAAALLVHGKLRLAGQRQHPVIFTSIRDDTVGGNADRTDGPAAPGDWEGILADPAPGGAGPVVDVDRARISYATWGLRARSMQSARVANTVIARTVNHGLVVHGTDTPPIVVGNALQNNGNGGEARDDHVAAGWVHSDHLDPALIADNYGTGNAVDTLLLSGTFTRDGTLRSRPAFPIGLGTGHCTVYDDCHNLARYELGVGEGTTLTVAPGSVIKAAGAGALVVHGRLRIVGEQQRPVWFTSIRDDSIGGDADRTDDPAEPGDWEGIRFPGASAGSSVRYVQVSYAARAFDIGVLDTFSVERSRLTRNAQAFAVRSTSDEDPVLGALPCVPPYTSTVDATSVWFGTSGYPGLAFDPAQLAGLVVPGEYAQLYAAVAALLNTDVTLGEDVIPWAIYSCADLNIPVTPVLFAPRPVEPF